MVSFIPSSGIENTIIKVTGVNFKKLKNVKVNGSTILSDQVSVNNEGTLITFTLPRPVPPLTTQTRTKIVIETEYGIGTSVSDFIYNPAQTNPGAPSSQVSSNQTPTPVLSQSSSNIAAQTNNQIGSTRPKTIITTSQDGGPSGLQTLSAQINSETPLWVFRNGFTLSYTIYKQQSVGVGRFTYSFQTLGPKKWIIVYENGNKIFEGDETISVSEAALIQEAKLALVGTYGTGVNSMTLVTQESSSSSREVIVKQNEIQLVGYLSTDRKTFSMSRQDIINSIGSDSSLLEVGSKLVLKATVYAQEPNSATPDTTYLPGTIVY